MQNALENMTREQLIEEAQKLQDQTMQLQEENTGLLEQSTEFQEQTVQKQDYIKQLESELADVRFQLDQYKRMIFASKRERFINHTDENQLTLPFDVEQDKSPEKEQEVITYVRAKNKKKEHPGRLPLPSHLPVEEIILEPEEDTSKMRCIGKEVTDQLELIPAKFFIKRYIRPKYIKPEDEQGLNHIGVIAQLPTFPIEKGIAGPGLLAQIMIDKFVDHLPIYRQIERFKREGIIIHKSTINGWQEAVCNLLEPLYDTLKHRVLSQGYLQVDETPINVLDKNRKGKTHRGYHWIYYSPLEKTVFFAYNNGRSREGPKKLLKDFTGYLQTDGYNVYEIFEETEGIIHLNCMAHARRHFEKALTYDKKQAEYAMAMFQQLYAIERIAREENYTPEQRYDLRMQKALPILHELGDWIVDTHKEVIPKSPLGKALEYSKNRWTNLMAYLHDGSLEIDNNLAENAIRPIALGRKNYLFAGSERGAQRAAMFYSLFGTCKKNGINPYDWLKHVLEVIPNYKVNRLTELLPQHMKM